jgi:AraC family transcriptional regulator
MGDAGKGYYTYMAGAEATGYERAEGYASYVLPCGEYAVCCFEAENFAELVGSAIFKASSFMNNWLQKHNLTCCNFAAEMYYGTSPDASYMDGCQ